MNTAYLSLGSNIEPEKNLPDALKRLAEFVHIEGVSSVWHTRSIGSMGPDFLNAAVKVSTELNAYTLKEEILCSLEESMGRIRLADKNAPRTIDVDILVFNQEVLDRHIFLYDHLILPLSELIPELRESVNSPSLREIASTHESTTSAYRVGHISN